MSQNSVSDRRQAMGADMRIQITEERRGQRIMRGENSTQQVRANRDRFGPMPEMGTVCDEF